MKNKTYILYILGAVIGFFAFQFAIARVQSTPILYVVAVISMAVMVYCVFILIKNNFK